MSRAHDTILGEILEHKRAEVCQRMHITPLSSLQEYVAVDPAPVRSLRYALQEWPAIIAEIKRCSPSRDEFRPGMSTVTQAQAYESGGAAAISVLTDEHYFGMRSEDLTQIRKSISLPVLRKDFILDEYSVYESRVLGADALLLIVSALAPAELTALYKLTGELGMEALVEVHDAAELEIALDAGATLVGINSRDLRTFATDLGVIEQVAQTTPKGVTLVAESGMKAYSELLALRHCGISGFLIGEALLVADDPAGKLRELRGEPARKGMAGP